MIAGLVLFACAMGVQLDTPAVNLERLADCIRQREGYRGHDGGAGERGPWQIREAVWVQHMEGRPFTHARQEKAARECALRHLRWLQGELERRGVAPMPFNLAAAWNAGVGGYTRGQAPVRAYEYASDVENLYRRGRK